MGYEEKIIDGVLMCRNGANADWKKVSEETLNLRIVEMTSELDVLHNKTKDNKGSISPGVKVEIIPFEMFQVKINGIDIGNFEKVDSWETIVKMRNNNGIIIANDNRGTVDRIFDGMSGSVKNPSFSVVKMTPSLVPTDSTEIKDNE